MRDARNADLERAIIADPSDVDSYLVYADWLIEQGDPRGELVTTQIAAETGGPNERRNAIAVFAKHRDYFFGGLSDKLRADALDWKRGFIHHANLANHFVVISEGARNAAPLGDIASELFAHPSARFLVKLTLGDSDPIPPQQWWMRTPPKASDTQGVLERLATQAPRTLRELVLLDPSVRTRLDVMCEGLPNLTDLDVRGRFTVNTVALPNLRRAAFRSPGMAQAQMRDLTRLECPRLTSLTIELGDGSAAVVMEDVDPLLRRIDLPLDHLAIVGCRFANQLLARLASAPILARLTELQITDGNLDDRGVRAVAREHRAFRHLELFDVTGNKLSGTGVRILEQIAPDVIA